jgi:putative intracellular protease/amidase
MQIAIVLYPGVTALDFVGPYEVLRWLPDAEVRFLWHEPGPITADSDVLIVAATHSFAETASPDVIVVPGGMMSTMQHARDRKLLDWVRTAHQTATWTTSVCSGSIILAAAGLLDGKPATSHWSTLPVLTAMGVTAVGDQRIVPEADIVTAAGVSAGIDLGLWLAARIGGHARAQAIQLTIEYDPHPPFDSGHTSKASAATKAAATALMSKNFLTHHQLTPMTRLIWEHSINKARSPRGHSRLGALRHLAPVRRSSPPGLMAKARKP